VIGMNRSTGQICIMAAEADLDEVFSIRRTILKENPRVTVAVNLMDAHFYIFEKWIIDFLKERKE